MDEETKIALARLIVLASDDTSGSRVAANFLLAWWNAPDLGGFDLSELWLLDDLAARDALLVFAFISRNNVYPDAFVGRAAIEALIRRWRPGAPVTD
jgi:hypothetical protein